MQVLKLCESLIPNFLAEDLKFATAFVNRRNEELHTGASSFINNKHSEWLYGFYKCCKI
ncbi:unnamed protein product [Commensalibacter communis]|nr:unnamed protein product [Commensalibacter communis]